MNKKVYIPIISATIMLLSAGLTSCEYKDLDDGSILSTVTLDFDTNNVGQSPTAMRAVFYPADQLTMSNMTMGYTIFDCPKSNWPTKCVIPAGKYYITTYNNDTGNILIEQMNDRDNIKATTFNYARGHQEKPSVIDSIYNNQLVLDCPDYMVHAVANNYHEIEVTPGENKTIKLFPDSMVVKVNFKLKEIKGLDWVRECRGSLNNVAGKRYITPDNVTEDSVAVMFDCNFNPDENTVSGSFYVFGLYPSNSTIVLSHKMVMYFWMNKGQIFLPIDVTEVINKAGREGSDVTIEIDDLDINLKDYVSSPNTFDINVDEWTDVNVEVGF